MSDPTCASCHKTIDPYGYAFENFGPMGDWREVYTSQESTKVEKVGGSDKQETPKAFKKADRKTSAPKTIPIDSSAQFRSGANYKDIIDYRKVMATKANSDRFVRCFIIPGENWTSTTTSTRFRLLCFRA